MNNSTNNYDKNTSSSTICDIQDARTMRIVKAIMSCMFCSRATPLALLRLWLLHWGATLSAYCCIEMNTDFWWKSLGISQMNAEFFSPAITRYYQRKCCQSFLNITLGYIANIAMRLWREKSHASRGKIHTCKLDDSTGAGSKLFWAMNIHTIPAIYWPITSIDIDEARKSVRQLPWFRQTGYCTWLRDVTEVGNLVGLSEKLRFKEQERAHFTNTIWLWLTARHGKSPFLIGRPSINRQFSMAMLNNQRVCQHICLEMWDFAASIHEHFTCNK